MTIGINPDHLREQVIRPVLSQMKMWSPAAEDLMLGTIAQESLLGHYLVQNQASEEIGAVGICQIEPSTAADTIYRYIDSRDDIEERFESAFQLVNTEDLDWSEVDLDVIRDKLITDLRFSVAVMRIKYWMIPKPLPAHGDVKGYAQYWKDHYNTDGGKGTPEEFIEKWYALVEGE